MEGTTPKEGKANFACGTTRETMSPALFQGNKTEKQNLVSVVSADISRHCNLRAFFQEPQNCWDFRSPSGRRWNISLPFKGKTRKGLWMLLESKKKAATLCRNLKFFKCFFQLMMKEAHTGGAKLWHQDYGYWYNNGCLYPEMGTVFIPVDKWVCAALLAMCYFWQNHFSENSVQLTKKIKS